LSFCKKKKKNQLVQGSEGLSIDLIQLQRDDRGAKELSRPILEYIMYWSSAITTQEWGQLLGKQLLQFTRWITLYLTLPYIWGGRDILLTS
jgi:hypothetical protein